MGHKLASFPVEYCEFHSFKDWPGCPWEGWPRAWQSQTFSNMNPQSKPWIPPQLPRVCPEDWGRTRLRMTAQLIKLVSTVPKYGFILGVFAHQKMLKHCFILILDLYNMNLRTATKTYSLCRLLNDGEKRDLAAPSLVNNLSVTKDQSAEPKKAGGAGVQGGNTSAAITRSKEWIRIPPKSHGSGPRIRYNLI